MVIDASRSDQVTKVLGFINTAVYTTLLGSFFNVSNVNNFPYLVKIDSYPNFCQHFVDQSGGNWGYIFVEHPSLKSHLDNVWYLNIDPSLYPTKVRSTSEKKICTDISFLGNESDGVLATTFHEV